MDTPRWVRLLVELFPRLSDEGFEVVDEPSDRYNCIAYAAGDTSEWWDHDEDNYWPASATRSDCIESLKEVFAVLGFEQCEDSRVEIGYQKVALYEEHGEWQHAAIQTTTGRWRSKMGKGPVMEHLSPESLSGGMYGSPTIYMRRTLSTPDDGE